MTILRFDEEELVTKLDLLPGKFRAAFAAACAQRQLPNYVRFAARTTTGDPDLLTQILDRLWDALEGEPDDNALQRDLELCMSLIPDERREGAPDQMYAEGAVASTAYAIGAQLSGKSQEAAWAARRAYETLDSHFVSTLNVGIVDRAVESYIVSQPLVQLEFQRQQTDLADLRAATKNGTDSRITVSKIRRRARESSMDLP
jgi:uncharacterized protein YjaG (DUF416 family)